MRNVAVTSVLPQEGSGVTPEETYQMRLDAYACWRDAYRLRRDRATAGIILLLLGIVPLFIVALAINALWVAVILGIAWVCAFVWAVISWRRTHERFTRYATLALVNEEGLLRLRRDWQALPLRQPPPPAGEHIYARDLDILGHASLQHLLSMVTSPAAQERLQSNLLTPISPEAARARQTAAIELIPMLDLRESLTYLGRHSGLSSPAYASFLAWAEGRPWLSERPWLLWLSRLLPLLLFATLVAGLSGFLRTPVWLVLVGVNLVLTWLLRRDVEARLDQVAEHQSVFQPYAEQFRRLETMSFTAPALVRLQAELTAEENDAARQMERLARLLRFGDVRLSIWYFLLQPLLLWNIHVLWLLEGWQRVAGSQARRWLEVLSEFEVIAGLATLAYENPSWTFPQISAKSSGKVWARNLGHPLLPPPTCVGNDVTIGPPGSFLLVTGSNMSGKSTLLRAIGVNIVLAQMGGPVCASALELPPVMLATSIRIQDSLEYGISYFMAELRKLKQVVDIAEYMSRDVCKLGGSHRR